MVRNVEGSAIWGETKVDKLSGDKDQKIDVFELPPQKALIGWWTPHVLLNCLEQNWSQIVRKQSAVQHVDCEVRTKTCQWLPKVLDRAQNSTKASKISGTSRLFFDYCWVEIKSSYYKQDNEHTLQFGNTRCQYYSKKFLFCGGMGSWGWGALRPYVHPPAACKNFTPVSTIMFQIP